MKKVLLFAIVLGGALTFTSCGSDECECTVNGVTETYTEDDAGDGSLEDACNALDALYKITSASNGCEMK
jgi:hypothetical protein